MYAGEIGPMGNNQMLACDRATGEVRRFLSGPTNCEITGATITPGGRRRSAAACRSVRCTGRGGRDPGLAQGVFAVCAAGPL